MIEDLLKDIIIDIDSLLKYEQKINDKKIKRQKLSAKEHFFDTYLVPPSFCIKLIDRRIKNEKNNG